MPNVRPTDDQLPILRELGDDLKRAFRASEQTNDQPASRPRPSMRRRVRVSIGSLALTASVIVAVGVVVLAVALLGHSPTTDRSPTAPSLVRPPTTTPQAISYRPLTSILGVLRRAQTQADRNPALLKLLRKQSRDRAFSVTDGTPVIALVRLATVAPWGAKVFLAVYQPLTHQEIARLPAKQQVVARAARVSLVIYSAGTTSGWQRAASIAGGRDLATPETQGSDRYVMVLPDGVTRVALWESTGSIRAHPHPLTRPHSRPVVVSVHDNIAAFRSQRLGPGVGREIWYGPSGNIIKRIANASSCGPPLGSCA